MIFLSQDSTICFTSIEIVIGPIPPGTGVIELTISFTSSKSTSPTRVDP